MSSIVFQMSWMMCKKIVKRSLIPAVVVIALLTTIATLGFGVGFLTSALTLVALYLVGSFVLGLGVVQNWWGSW